MTFSLYLFIIILNFWAANRYSKTNRANRFISIISFIGLFVLIGGYRNESGLSNDISNLGYEFDSVLGGGDSIYEGLFAYIIALGRYTADYYEWRYALSLVSLFLLFYSSYKWSKNPHLPIALFAAYLSVLSAEQLRNFLAMAVFQIGLVYYIFSPNKKRDKLIYVLTTLLASSIHTSFIIYIIIIFYETLLESRTKRIAFGVIIGILCFGIFLGGNNIGGLSTLMNSINDNSFSVYLSTTTRFGFVLPIMLHLSVLYYLSVAQKVEPDSVVIRRMLTINTILMVVFPLYMIQLSFYRIERNILYVSYISIASAYNFSQRSNETSKFTFSYILSLILWIVIDLFITTPKENLLIPFFSDNFFLQ